MPREIYTQGHFDGACFLYAIANAYTALTDCEVDQKTWNRLIPNVPYLQNFMHDKGTNGIKDNILSCIIHNILQNITKEHKFTIVNCKKDSLKNALNNSSVAVFAIDGDTRYQKELDHWVCGIGYRKNNMLIACSCRGYNKPIKTIDKCSNGRLYNDWLISDEEIVNKNIFVISLSS